MKVSDAERIASEWVDAMEAVTVERDGATVEIHCVDEFRAQDMVNSIGLMLADKIAGWRRVVEAVPSPDERSERLSALIREHAAKGRDTEVTDGE